MRCSSLPLLWLCPGSGRSDDGAVLVDAHHGASDDGSDAHRLMASWPDGSAPKAMLDELTDDARIGYFTAAKMWREEISAWMPGSEAELHAVCGADVDLSGHIDRASIMGGGSTKKAVVLDWKFGRKDRSYKHQGFGYAWLVFRSYGDVDQVTVHFAWVSTQEMESYTVSRQRAEEWYRELCDRVVNWDGRFHTGDHCAHCPRSSTCPALRQLAKRDVDVLSTAGTPDVTAMEPAQLVDFHRRLAVLESVLKSAKANVRLEVGRRGDVLGGDGYVLHLVEENGQRSVDTLKAWDVLNDSLDPDELAACLNVRIGDVEEAVAKKAGRGKGAEAKRVLAKRLDEVGAVTQGKQTKLRLERVK